MENYEQLKQVIQAANPGIVDTAKLEKQVRTIIATPWLNYAKRIKADDAELEVMQKMIDINTIQLMETLGRPIRLADVLVAIQNTGVACAFYGDNKLWLVEPDLKENLQGRKNCTWNLLHDSLDWHYHNQPETVKFLIEALVPKKG